MGRLRAVSDSARKTGLGAIQSASKLTVITYVPEPFSVQSAGDAFTTALTAGAVGVFTGGLGGAVVGAHADSKAKSEGEKWAQAYALSDPAAEVRSSFIETLSGRFSLPALDIVPDVVAGDEEGKRCQEPFLL